MKNFIEEYWLGIVFGLIVLLIVGFFIFKHQNEKAKTIQTQQKIVTLAKRYNAITDWGKKFNKDGIKIGKGHRAVYTTDIEKALIRKNGQPVLIVGYVFDITTIGDNKYLGIKAFEYPDLNFLLKCQSQHTELVLSQQTDDGNFFAVVASVVSVSRPAFEVDTITEEADDESYSDIIVEPGDQYILQGTCLDISYVGHYE